MPAHMQVLSLAVPVADPASCFSFRVSHACYVLVIDQENMINRGFISVHPGLFKQGIHGKRRSSGGRVYNFQAGKVSGTFGKLNAERLLDDTHLDYYMRDCVSDRADQILPLPLFLCLIMYSYISRDRCVCTAGLHTGSNKFTEQLEQNKFTEQLEQTCSSRIKIE